MTVNISNAAEIREVFTLAWDTYSGIDPVTIEQETGERINTRFAREILGVLTKAEFLIEDETPAGASWIVNADGLGLAHDPETRDDALQMLDAWLTPKGGKPATKSSKPAAKSDPNPDGSAPVDQGKCYCGCGENVSSKSFYRPGHDARHAGRVGRQAAESSLAGQGAVESKEFYMDLPSQALVNKAVAIALKAYAKAVKKAGGEPAITEGQAKVGKNMVEARRVETDPPVVEVRKGDGWVAASKSASNSFVPSA